MLAAANVSLFGGRGNNTFSLCVVAGVEACFSFFTLVIGPRKSLNLKLSNTRVYEPEIRTRSGTTAQGEKTRKGWEVEFEAIRKMLVCAADTGFGMWHNA